jgi:hypothetical protein
MSLFLQTPTATSWELSCENPETSCVHRGARSQRGGCREHPPKNQREVLVAHEVEGLSFEPTIAGVITTN